MTGSGVDQVLVEGTGAGDVVVLDEPLSFWGGLDAATGRIVDRRHPQHGVSLDAKVVVMPSGRGSSSSSTILAEAVRRGTAPAAILLARRDAIIALGALVARELYGSAPPVAIVDEATYEESRGWRRARVRATADGTEIAIRN